MARIAYEPSAHTYEVYVDRVEVTRGPTINHPGDRERKFAYGPVHYLIDGVEVDEETWNTATKAAGLSFND